MSELMVFFIAWYAVIGYGLNLGWNMIGDWLEIYYP